jgi:hypothetical protein
MRTPIQATLIFNHKSHWLKVSLLVMFLLATLIRLDEIRAPGHLLDREYTSAIFARAYYFSSNDSVEEWRRDIAITAKNQQPILEPPLLEYLVSLIYRVVGREDLIYSRYLTNAFWLIGGVFMFLSTKKLLSTDEAIIATTYYLFVPMGIIISRSFQPDSLMMMLFLISFYLLILYFDTPTKNRLFFAAITTGLTLLLRPLVIFAIFCAFLALSFNRNQSWKKLIDLPLTLFSIVSLLPFILYYGYGILFAGYMSWKVSTSFMPHLLSKINFWQGWINNVIDVAEFTPLFLAIIGFFLLKTKKVKYLIIGLTISFIIFSATFTYHIHTHPYYHIQLFPIVGICLAPVIVVLIQLLKQRMEKYWYLPIIGVSLFSMYFGYQEVLGQLFQTRMENPATAWEIGELIRHSPHTVYIAYYYGIPLEYHGEFGGAPWPVRMEDPFYRDPDMRELSVQERISNLGFSPEYFVITNFDLYYRKHPDLDAYLEENCKILSKTELYLIYESCNTQENMDPLSDSKIE